MTLANNHISIADLINLFDQIKVKPSWLEIARRRKNIENSVRPKNKFKTAISLSGNDNYGDLKTLNHLAERSDLRKLVDPIIHFNMYLLSYRTKNQVTPLPTYAFSKPSRIGGSVHEITSNPNNQRPYCGFCGTEISEDFPSRFHYQQLRPHFSGCTEHIIYSCGKPACFALALCNLSETTDKSRHRSADKSLLKHLQGDIDTRGETVRMMLNEAYSQLEDLLRLR